MASLPQSTRDIAGARVPRFFYGTAWKEEETERLVALAIEQGFRGIDTANQRKHYHEAAVGQAIHVAIQKGMVTRDDLFLQTKFTCRAGQDSRLPYDPHSPFNEQVRQSFASSLEHLGVERIDSFLLHGPTQRQGLTAADWEIWRAIEDLQMSGKVRFVGVSNFTLEQLEALCAQARVQPTFVQNRCYAVRSWDRAVRKYCELRGIVYQGFSLLTANLQVLAHAEMSRIARQHQRTINQVVFRFALEVGMIPLTGTSSAEHMRQDLDALHFALAPDEVQRIERLATL
jgi:diketogulonate reductase-like aldo/keto reductase